MFKLVFGKSSVIKSEAILRPHETFPSREAVMKKVEKETPSKDIRDMMPDDFPRVSITKESAKDLDAWVKQWVSQHKHLEYEATGRECENLARALAQDILLYLEFDGGNKMLPIVGVWGAKSHATTVVMVEDKWVAYEPRQGRLPRLPISFNNTVLWVV